MPGYLSNFKIMGLFSKSMCRGFERGHNADFEEGGLYYKNIDAQNRSVEVVNASEYSDDVVIPDAVLHEGRKFTVTAISNNAFANCKSLTSLSIPSSVTSIGCHFTGCSSLEILKVAPDSSTYASVDGVLYNKELTKLIRCPQTKTSVSIPDTVTEIAESAFEDCHSLGEVHLPVSVAALGVWSLSGCTSLVSLTIPERVTFIGDGTFNGCTSLVSVILPEQLTAIGHKTFSGCLELRSVKLPQATTIVDVEAFGGCKSLDSVTFNDGLNEICDLAFIDCCALTTLCLPESLQAIGEDAFEACTALTDVACLALVPPKAPLHVFDDKVLINAKLQVPSQSLEAYKAADPWRNFFRIEAI